MESKLETPFIQRSSLEREGIRHTSSTYDRYLTDLTYEGSVDLTEKLGLSPLALPAVEEAEEIHKLISDGSRGAIGHDRATQDIY